MAQLVNANQPTEIRASHILVKHKKSRRLASWKDPQGNELKQRTIQDADNILLSFLQIINGSSNKAAKFWEIAKKHSDCGSANAGPSGDLGVFKFDDMQKPFSQAAFSLNVGAITQNVVHSPSGSHLIMRTKIKLPKKVRASHLLIKHIKSRNPVSRNQNKDTDGSLIKKRSIKDADKQLLQLLAQINASNDKFAKFTQLAQIHSDCGSYQRGGDLNFFEFDKMQTPFSAATFTLDIGQITQYCVHTDSGSHLIMRTA